MTEAPIPPVTQVDFSRHPLVLNARSVSRYRTLAFASIGVSLAIFIAGIMVSRRNQKCVILFGGQRVAVGELKDLSPKSPLLVGLCKHYADQLLTWDWRYKEGLLRPSHLIEIATPSGKSEIDGLRSQIFNDLSKNKANQMVEVEDVVVKKDGRDLKAVVTGRLNVFNTVSNRTFVDAFELQLKLKATYEDELRDDADGNSFFSFFKRKGQNGVEFFYPYVISTFTVQKENIQ